MQLRCVGLRISTGADIPNDLAARDLHVLVKSRGIMVQMRVVVAVGFRIVELVNRQAAGHAVK